MSTDLKLTAAEYERMVAKGAFDELRQKIELINGAIVSMNPAGPVHDDIIEFLTRWSTRNTDEKSVGVRVQSGLDLSEFDSRPEPDIAWVKAGRYVDGHPRAEHVLLLIEVSDSSPGFDLVHEGRLVRQSRHPRVLDSRRECERGTCTPATQARTLRRDINFWSVRQNIPANSADCHPRPECTLRNDLTHYSKWRSRPSHGPRSGAFARAWLKTVMDKEG